MNKKWGSDLLGLDPVFYKKGWLYGDDSFTFRRIDSGRCRSDQ